MLSFMDPSRVRGVYEEALSQFLVFCTSSVTLSGAVSLFMTLLIQKFVGLDLALAGVVMQLPHILSAWMVTEQPEEQSHCHGC